MNDRLGIVHGVWLSPRNIAQIADAGACVVHNPISNLKLKSGIAPILDLYRAGIDIALGCDNCSCAETQNIFTAMRMLCLRCPADFFRSPDSRSRHEKGIGRRSGLAFVI